MEGEMISWLANHTNQPWLGHARHTCLTHLSASTVTGLGAQTPDSGCSVQSLTLLLPSCVTFSKLLTLSEPRFFFCKMGS